MRELRQDVSYNLETPKEELDQIDDMKIEEVLMGLKGLKQEEVFSFLGKTNFTATEIEEWLKMMSSAGLSNFDQLTSGEAIDMEQLQLSFNANFEALQNNSHQAHSHSHHNSRAAHRERARLRTEAESNRRMMHEYARNICEDVNSTEWSPVKCPKAEEDIPQQGFQSLPRYHHDYLMDEYPVEGLREEEIVATNIVEEMICTSNMDDKEDFTLNNTYVIENSTDALEIMEKPKPIKLLIKRVESEDEIPEIPVARIKSKRCRQPSVRLEEIEKISPPCKRRRSLKKESSPKEKNKNHSSITKREHLLEDVDFPFVNTVHQDDDYVYPSLELSDEEGDDVYTFSHGDDETWTPKVKIKSNNLRIDRPARDRKRNSAVAKYLEAAALKRAEPLPTLITSNKCSRKISKKKSVTKGGMSMKNFDNLSMKEDLTLRISSPKDHLPHDMYPVPSTSASHDDETYNPLLSCYDTTSASELSDSTTSVIRKTKDAKNKNKSGVTKAKRIIPPKTNKLLQPPSHEKQSSISLQIASTKKSVKHNLSLSSSCTPSSEKKLSNAAYITKRGKPKKGMATAKQRLGKILKMHKMFF